MSRSLTQSPVNSPSQPPPPAATALLVADREALNAAVPLYQAVSDHTPRHGGELSLTAGDIITSVRQLGNGWALGRNESAPDRAAGIFPVACVVAVTTSPPPAAADKFFECRRCGGSLPVSRTQPASAERACIPAQKRLSGGHWCQHSGLQAADLAAPPARVNNRADIELIPQSSLTDTPPPAGATPRTVTAAQPPGDGDEMTATTRGVLFPGGDELMDSPSTVPRRQAPLPPKPQLVVKPTRDADQYATPSKSAGRNADLTAATDPVSRSSVATAAASRQQDGADMEDDDDQRWCGTRRAGRQRRSRGPPPPPPARALSTFVGQSDPTLRHTVVSTSSAHSVGDVTDSHCACCIDSLAAGRRHAAALRTRRPHSGIPSSMNNRSSSPAYRDLSFGVPVQPGALRTGRPVLKARTARVAAGNMFTRPGRRHSLSSSSSSSRLSVWSASCRLIASMCTGLLLGILTFAVLFYDQSCHVYWSLVAGFAVAVISALVLGVSRFCRCAAALLAPSVCTTRGRLALCLVTLSVLLGGPVLNVYSNCGEAVRSLTCSAELALNRTASLLRPFDAMMNHLDRTVSRLEGAAADVAHGLKPLDEGLDEVEKDVENARTQLLGTRRVSHFTYFASRYNVIIYLRRLRRYRRHLQALFNLFLSSLCSWYIAPDAALVYFPVCHELNTS